MICQRYVPAGRWYKAREARDEARRRVKLLRAKVEVRERKIAELGADLARERQERAEEKLELQRSVARMRAVAAAWKMKAEGVGR